MKKQTRKPSAKAPIRPTLCFAVIDRHGNALAWTVRHSAKFARLEMGAALADDGRSEAKAGQRAGWRKAMALGYRVRRVVISGE